jgi:predicted signal transduction protein with EAL and GGDEF domain
MSARLAPDGALPATRSSRYGAVSVLDDVDAVEALAALKDLGVRLAIDDFGTGYSSLSYLKQFPFDELKIDATFVAGLGHASDDAIVAATIDMAHGLGMVAAAEGVETETQLRRLRELGCDLAQGFYISRPQATESIDGIAAGVPLEPATTNGNGTNGNGTNGNGTNGNGNGTSRSVEQTTARRPLADPAADRRPGS